MMVRVRCTGVRGSVSDRKPERSRRLKSPQSRLSDRSALTPFNPHLAGRGARGPVRGVLSGQAVHFTGGFVPVSPFQARTVFPNTGTSHRSTGCLQPHNFLPNIFNVNAHVQSKAILVSAKFHHPSTLQRGKGAEMVSH